MALLVLLLEDVQQFPGRAGVQGPGGFVSQKEAGPGDKGPGGGCPLLLSPGDLPGVFVQQTLNAQQLRQGEEPPGHLLKGLFGQHQGEDDVIPQGEGIQQAAILEDKAQVIPAKGGEPPPGDGGKALALQQNLPGGGFVQGGQEAQQGGLPAAALPHNGGILPLLHGEGDALKGGGAVPAPGAIDFFQLADFQ